MISSEQYLLQLPPSPYPYGVKCYVTRTRDGWKIIGHRWGQVPYHVDTIKHWPSAVKRAQQHVEGGGLRWAPAVR